MTAPCRLRSRGVQQQGREGIALGLGVTPPVDFLQLVDKKHQRAYGDFAKVGSKAASAFSRGAGFRSRFSSEI